MTDPPTENSTDFYPKDAPRHLERKYERFRQYNTGQHRSQGGDSPAHNEQVNRNIMYHHEFHAIAGQFALPARTVERAHYLFEDVLPTMKRAFSNPALACACVLRAFNENAPPGSRYQPQAPEAGDGDFESVIDRIGIDHQTIANVYVKLFGPVSDTDE